MKNLDSKRDNREESLLSRSKIKINKAFNTGFFHIFSSSVLRNILFFISGIILVRIIPKSVYGTYSYANNIVSYFMLFSGLGIASAIFQICCEKRKDGDIPQEIFNYGISWGYSINIVLSLLIVVYSFIFSGSAIRAEEYLIFLSFLPLVNILYELLTLYYRSKSDNKRYASINIISATLTFILSIIGSLLFGVWGMILSNYLTPIISFAIARVHFGYSYSFKFRIGKELEIDIWKLAITSMAANAISSIMYMIDISMVGMFLKDGTQVASYKIASTIPSALYFLTSTIVTYIYPYFAEHKDDIVWTKYRAKQTLLGCSMLFGTICCGLFIVANPIITIVFGNQYADAVPVFKILVIAFFFQSTFRGIFGNLLVTQRKIKFNLIESILTGIANIIGDYVLIQKYGAVGVAISTLIVMVFSGTLATSYYFFVLNKKKKQLGNIR